MSYHLKLGDNHAIIVRAKFKAYVLQIISNKDHVLMLKKSPFTKSGLPTAFLPETLKQTITTHTETNSDGSISLVKEVQYTLKAYHATARSNKNVGLSFGTARYSFYSAKPHIFEQYSALDYAGLLEAVVNTSRLFSDVFVNDFICGYIVGNDIVWDGTSSWVNPAEDSAKLKADILPKLVMAYPNLPDVPVGADGWYKVR
jgi:hypothetical protein